MAAVQQNMPVLSGVMRRRISLLQGPDGPG
jgi:hypothetical protein